MLISLGTLLPASQDGRAMQLLFNAEEDVRAYVAWTQRSLQLERMYTRFEGLDPVVVDLLEGVSLVLLSRRYLG